MILQLEKVLIKKKKDKFEIKIKQNRIKFNFVTFFIAIKINNALTRKLH